jgi:integrase
MRLAMLAALWFEELESEGRLRPQSIDTYRLIWSKHLEPAVGRWLAREATVSRVDRVIKAINVKAPGQVHHSRVVLSGILGLAVRHDALPTNPMRSISRSPIRGKDVRRVDVALLEAVRRAVREHRSQRDEHGHLPPGPRPSTDLTDIIDLLLATGARPGEVLALMWDGVDLLAEQPTVTISGTVVAVRSVGLVRQPAPKTSNGRRTLVLPRFAVDTLLRRRQAQASTPNPLNAVFPSRRGTWRYPNNVARSWRDVRAEAGLGDIQLKQFRATVATLIAAEADAQQAKGQLGHGSEVITERYYIAQASIAPDSSAILEQLGPRIVLDE